MERENLRQAIFDIIAFVNNYELSNAAQKLVLHYFNNSKQQSSYERAIEAIITYVPGAFDGEVKNSTTFQKLLVRLKKAAELWDRV